jgi:tetratricopeptide (TPR) repeat protein
VKRLVTNLAIALACIPVIACTDPAVAKRKYVEKADALVTQGKYQEAVLEYRNAIKLDPKFGEARYKLAGAYVQTQNGQQAGKEYLRAAELMPERADVQLKAAGLALAAKDYESARKYAEAALKANP